MPPFPVPLDNANYHVRVFATIMDITSFQMPRLWHLHFSSSSSAPSASSPRKAVQNIEVIVHYEQEQLFVTTSPGAVYN